MLEEMHTTLAKDKALKMKFKVFLWLYSFIIGLTLATLVSHPWLKPNIYAIVPIIVFNLNLIFLAITKCDKLLILIGLNKYKIDVQVMNWACSMSWRLLLVAWVFSSGAYTLTSMEYGKFLLNCFY